MKNKALVAVDASYWYYVTMFRAVSDFQKKDSVEASIWLKPANEVDQNNLPNILNCSSFKRILKNTVMKKCEVIDWYLKNNYQDKIDLVDKIDIIFAMDDFTSRSFRHKLYPGYKAHRKLIPRQFDMLKVRNYVFNVLFKELELEDKYGYKFISVDGAEADDIIATAMSKCSADYMLKVLFASDHDFIQLENVNQINLLGKEVECKIADCEVTPQEYLLGKILLGDSSDNISKVFKNYGPKKVLNLIHNKEKLKSMLQEDQNAAHQFQLNKKLISFNEIPKDLSDKISEKINKALYENEFLNDNLKMFGNLEML